MLCEIFAEESRHIFKILLSILYLSLFLNKYFEFILFDLLIINTGNKINNYIVEVTKDNLYVIRYVHTQ